MPWRPAFPPVPRHAAQAFDFRVAEVSTAVGRPAGHLLVIAEPYARMTGHLWWTELTDPYFTLEVMSVIDGEFDNPFLSGTVEVDEAVEELRRDEWLPHRPGPPTAYRLRWLPDDEAETVSAEVLGVDLADERRRRERPARPPI